MLLKEQLNTFNQPGQLPVDVRMQQTMIDTLFNPLFDPPSGPVLLGWLDHSPLKLDVMPSRVEHQQLTGIVAHIDIALSQTGTVTLARGWFDPIFEVAGAAIGGPCVTRSGDGWFVDSGVMTSTMRLPASLESPQVAQAVLMVERDGPPSEMKLSVYDWTSKQWVEQALLDSTATLAQPTRYFSPTGLLKAQVEVVGESEKGGGCVSINLRVEGKRR
jgi:hypothetical protein